MASSSTDTLFVHASSTIDLDQKFLHTPILSHIFYLPATVSPRGDTDLRKSSVSDLLHMDMDMKRSSNAPTAANLKPKVTCSGETCSRSFSDLNSARQLKSASLRNSIIKMVLFVLKRFCDTFASVKSMVPSLVFAVATILCSSASPIVRDSECASEKPCSESPMARTVSESNSWKRIWRSIELTKNKSQHHSDPGSYGQASPTWVVSSAAPRHATGNRALLSGLVAKHGDTFVHAVDEMPMPVVAHGTAVTDEIDLPHVCLVPGLAANLVSVCQLVEMDYSVEFGGGMCYIRNSSDGTIIGKARLRKGGLYVLDFLMVPLGV